MGPRWLRVRWRWFRLEFNRRAHDRVYYDEPIAAVYDNMIFAHPSLAARLRETFEPPADIAGLPAFGPFVPLFGMRVIESPTMVRRTWKWVRR